MFAQSDPKKYLPRFSVIHTPLKKHMHQLYI